MKAKQRGTRAKKESNKRKETQIILKWVALSEIRKNDSPPGSG